MAVFNEDTRVKIPATIQFLRLGYQYQSLKTDDADIDFHTKIFINRFKTARVFNSSTIRKIPTDRIRPVFFVSNISFLYIAISGNLWYNNQMEETYESYYFEI